MRLQRWQSLAKWMTTGDPKNYFMAHLKYVFDHEDYAGDVKEFVAEQK